jgi:hypothetical protein
VFAATGGRIRSGPEAVQFLGPFLTATLGKDGKIIAPIGAPNTVMILARSPGQAIIDVITGEPWKNFDTTTLVIVIDS